MRLLIVELQRPIFNRNQLRSLPYLKSGDESTQLSVADKLQGFAGGLEKGQRRDTMAEIGKGPLTRLLMRLKI